MKPLQVSYFLLSSSKGLHLHAHITKDRIINICSFRCIGSDSESGISIEGLGDRGDIPTRMYPFIDDILFHYASHCQFLHLLVVCHQHPLAHRLGNVLYLIAHQPVCVFSQQCLPQQCFEQHHWSHLYSAWCGHWNHCFLF